MSISGNHGLSYAATVSRQLVHRAAVCEVFLTDTRRRSDNDFLIAAQLPRVHSYYSDHLATPAAYDPLLLLEVFRQTSILVAHEHLGVPLGPSSASTPVSSPSSTRPPWRSARCPGMPCSPPPSPPTSAAATNASA
ncbi:AfsA-related hotdog domain-containing protein [Streptomyces sp. C8S0]|uniref:AfsA-related hotdog domain-containing protein n=1 Tax=Streptomyces sp. C8S0 TaxID=2585716 RepID=UPI001D04FA50|nr:AfsA-related hotdog domain-containing protein [Streptomyces sp. C8S0]